MRNKLFPASLVEFLVILIFISIISIPVFIITDVFTGKIEGGFVKLVYKQYIPERNWTTWEYDSENERFESHDHHEPEHWNFSVIYKGNDFTSDVGVTQFHRYDVGDNIPIVTRKGGITGAYYGFRVQRAED